MATPTPTPNTATTTRPERSSRRTARKSPMGWLPWALLGLLALLVAAVLLVINAVDDDGPEGAAGDTLGQVGSNGSGLDGQDGDGAIAGTEDESADSSEGTGTGSSSAQTPAADAGSAETPAPDAGSAETPAPDGGSAETPAPDGGSASLTADGEDLLASAGGSLAPRAGQEVTGTARVESVVSDEGFWVGSSPEQRVFVYLTPEARRTEGESGFQVTAGQTVQLTGVLVALSQSPQAAEGVTDDEGRGQLDAQAAFVNAQSVRLA